MLRQMAFFKQQVIDSLASLHRKVNTLMSEQARLDADVAEMQQQNSDELASLATVESEFVSLKNTIAASGVGISLTGLEAAIASHKDTVTAASTAASDGALTTGAPSTSGGTPSASSTGTLPSDEPGAPGTPGTTGTPGALPGTPGASEVAAPGAGGIPGTP